MNKETNLLPCASKCPFRLRCGEQVTKTEPENMCVDSIYRAFQNSDILLATDANTVVVRDRYENDLGIVTNGAIRTTN